MKKRGTNLDKTALPTSNAFYFCKATETLNDLTVISHAYDPMRRLPISVRVCPDLGAIIINVEVIVVVFAEIDASTDEFVIVIAAEVVNVVTVATVKEFRCVKY